MSRTISTNLATHLASENTTIAHCLKITRKDSTVFGFTDLDVDIIYGGVTYYAATGSNLTALSGSSDMSVDNADMETILDAASITADDIKAGLWDLAEWELFLVNYRDLTMGKLDLSRGWIGEVEYGSIRCKAEARSLFDTFSQKIIETIGPDCRADFCDTRCGLNVATYTETGTLTSVTSNQAFEDSSRTEDDAYFSGGKLTWTSGNNNGRSMEVKTYTKSTGQFILFQTMPDDIQVGDTYSVYRGCDKSFTTCKALNNQVNFRGEPHLPGLAKLMQYRIR